MNSFYVTFPERLKRTPSEAFPAAHPEGWVTVQAESEGEARWMARVTFGTDFFGVYPAVHEADYPRGELAVLKRDPANENELCFSVADGGGSPQVPR